MTTITVFVIAHPDDESMFFLPTICGLHGDHKRWLVCLSNGNYNGLGTTREIELHRVGGYLGFDRIVVINHGGLQDSPTDRWSKHAVARVLEKTLLLPLSNSDTNVVLYTFDEKGVSGHINHVDTYLGVQFYLQTMDQTVKGTIRGFQLISEDSLRRKYLPLLHWVALLCDSLSSSVATLMKTDGVLSSLKIREQRAAFRQPFYQRRNSLCETLVQTKM
ncbi:N-acetylglucosaminylphosphatidylinositol deacetylase [Fragilaria crotonensis]|nr:N-acetylglucosaminylphosphatidylinositol deacetylase [Fragilaria crotonensis]